MLVSNFKFCFAFKKIAIYPIYIYPIYICYLIFLVTSYLYVFIIYIIFTNSYIVQIVIECREFLVP